jgi:glycosyltransferase involved in cell wall biosynthesis
MIIGIDIRMLSRGVRSGIEEYVYQITRALVKNFPQHEFRLWYNARNRITLDFPWLKSPNVRLVEGVLPNRLIDITAVTFGWPKVDEILGGVDVFFSPHFFVASMARAPRVITFHDLSFVRYPEFFPWQKRLWHWRMRLRKQIASAAHLISVSESTKRDLINYFGVSDKKVTLIYEGVDPKEFAPLPKEHLWLKEFRKRQSLPEKFFLFLATLEPRKNVEAVLEAFRFAHEKGILPKDVHLVIAGNIGWLAKKALQLGRSPRLAEIVHFRSVNPEERKFWYNAAEGLLFPSFFEGFGLPPLEAMACGKPVITSNRSSIPEVVADAAIMVDPFRPEELAAAMAAVLAEFKLREALVRKGLERIAEFTWSEAAQKTFEVFEKIG